MFAQATKSFNQLAILYLKTFQRAITSYSLLYKSLLCFSGNLRVHRNSDSANLDLIHPSKDAQPYTRNAERRVKRKQKFTSELYDRKNFKYTETVPG